MDAPLVRRVVDGVEVELAVVLASTELSAAELCSLAPGETLAFPQGPAAPLEIELDGVAVATGRAVERDGLLGVRVAERVARLEP